MPKLPTAHRELVFTLLAASRRVELHLDRALSDIKGISLSEYELLRSLGESHQATATRVDLAAAVSRTPSGVTRALRPLEKLGYVVTKKDARDARRSLAKLTPQGVTLVRHAAKIVDQTLALSRSIPALSEADRGTTLGFLEELARDW